jgi:carbonic anhydrase/acetyltransferase-like protein (isoleucine patch superfamily)
MPLYEFEGKRPTIGQGTWIAPGAQIIGAVTIGRDCYIGFNAVIRADFGVITIGDETAVEEGVIIHEAERVTIGSRVIIGHMAMIHDATIEDCALIGMQSMICDYARICQWAMVAEKSLVMKRQTIPSHEIFAGVPARKIGTVTDRHKERLALGQQLYAGLPKMYAGSFKEITPEAADTRSSFSEKTVVD